ncbi:MAG: FAD binding domain-containing protein [Sulfolobales archaeon]|nr:FAD binding domain-containing protein [Sulfolobales archaeon]
MLSINAFNTYRIPQQLKYFKPGNLQEALEILESVEGAKVIAGGTDLVVDLKYRRVEARALVDISRLSELRFIKLGDGYVEIGSAATIREIAESGVVKEKLPLLAEAAESLGSWQIRNLATVGGNLCTASPAADTAPPLLAYDAELELVSSRGVRIVPLGKFFTGPKKTVIERAEILRSVRVPLTPRTYGWCFIKLRRTSFDIAKVSVAVLLRVEGGFVADVRIALGSVAPTPVRARSAEKLAIGLKFEDAVRVASERVAGDISPIDDARSTAWYRLQTSKVLVKDAMWRAYERFLGAGAWR